MEGSKKAEPINCDEEEILWQKEILDHKAEALLNTMIYKVYFSLCGGSEHQNLRHKPSQIQWLENPAKFPFFKYSQIFQRIIIVV